MGKVIKVSIPDKGHSTGRGVGYYTEFLKKSLLRLSEVKLTDNDPDIIHYPFFDPFYHTLPTSFDKPTIVTIHDLTPLVMSDRFPKGVLSTISLFLQWWSVRKVSAIITDSENSKRDIEKYFFINPEKIHVTPLAVDPVYSKAPSAKFIQEVKKKYNLPDRFVLSVPGGPDPNKNIPSLAEVTARLGIPLVAVGSSFLQEVKHPVPPELLDLVRLGVYKHIITPGFVPTDEVNAMYHLATLYASTSLYEGFGLPLLQAMTAGCLFVSSRASSLPEIYHQEAITCNPKSLKSMEKAISKALALSPIQKQKQINLAKKKSREFNWEKTAKQTLGVYKSIL